MANRRDYTNQHGAFVPTETKALNNINKKPTPPPVGKKHGDTLREDGLKKIDANRKTFSEFVKEGGLDSAASEHLKDARKLYQTFENIAGMFGFKITHLELKAKGTAEEYYRKGSLGMEQGCYEIADYD